VDGPAGPVHLTKANGGGLIFYGSKSNTWSGGTTISEGWINMRDPLVEVAGSGSQLGLVPTSFSPNNVVIYDGAKLINDQVNTLHANRGIGVIGNSYIVATYGSLTLNGPIGDYTNIVGNVIFDCTGVYNVNAGWILGGASTYSGTTTVNGCFLKLAGNNRLPVTSPLYINGTNTTYPPLFDLAVYNQSLAGLFGGVGAVKGTITNSATGTSMLTLTGASDFDGALLDGGAGSGKYLALTVNAANQTVTFSGVTNRIVGAAAITAGTLNLSSNGMLTAGATTFGVGSGLAMTLATNAARLTVNGNLGVSGATLTLGGTPAAQTVYTLATYSGTLTQPFASVSGVPSGWFIDYGTGNNSSIRLRPPPAGILIYIR
jgi:fibronectin-binding autotransporter adhesin